MRGINIAGIALLVSLSLVSGSVAAAAPITKEHCLHGDRLQKAAAKGDIRFVQACLKAKVPIDAIEANGWTALHAAAFSGQVGVVDFLLKQGAKLGLKDKNGHTPMALATRQKHQLVVKRIGMSRDKKPQGLGVSDAKAKKLAEALRWELNNYGPTSSDDSIDYQVSEIVSVEKDSSTASGVSYTVTVKFKTGVFYEGTDVVIYKGTVLESDSGHFSVSEYDSVE